MSKLVKFLALLLPGFLVACSDAETESHPYGFGMQVSEQVIAKWDIDIGPDGAGLPEGSGTAEIGEPIYLAKCAFCHGEFGEGMGRFPDFVGTPEELLSDFATKNVGSYWPYATTLWDYIYRAMPFGNAQSLTADEVYSITAYILSLNNIIAEDAVMDAKSLPEVKMPNRDGFIVASGTDINASICMKNCVKEVVVTSKASESRVSLAEKEEAKNTGDIQ